MSDIAVTSHAGAWATTTPANGVWSDGDPVVSRQQPAPFARLVDARRDRDARVSGQPRESKRGPERGSDTVQSLKSFAEMSMFGARATVQAKRTNLAMLHTAQEHATSASAKEVSTDESLSLVSETVHVDGKHAAIIWQHAAARLAAMPTTVHSVAHVPSVAAPRTMALGVVAGVVSISADTIAFAVRGASRPMLQPWARLLGKVHHPVAIAVGLSRDGLFITGRFDRASADQFTELELAIARFARAQGHGIRALMINGRQAAI